MAYVHYQSWLWQMWGMMFKPELVALEDSDASHNAADQRMLYDAAALHMSQLSPRRQSREQLPVIEGCCCSRHCSIVPQGTPIADSFLNVGRRAASSAARCVGTGLSLALTGIALAMASRA
eukprot:CAMPEP_0119356750 /NCGR_PEP_ID=MMETSP1334-20130426/5279_1 /TAXON_ID=127549 /ORGANISM="Calcidiscus leptoporus, Strain RCC1130" /LENGTH=120 /DNA_ID=CAMNT_0007370845 /DNA_START=51 /DNA_END=414 /DNA_ORIENTATION=-